MDAAYSSFETNGNMEQPPMPLNQHNDFAGYARAMRTAAGRAGKSHHHVTQGTSTHIPISKSDNTLRNMQYELLNNDDIEHDSDRATTAGTQAVATALGLRLGQFPASALDRTHLHVPNFSESANTINREIDEEIGPSRAKGGGGGTTPTDKSAAAEEGAKEPPPSKGSPAAATKAPAAARTALTPARPMTTAHGLLTEHDFIRSTPKRLTEEKAANIKSFANLSRPSLRDNTAVDTLRNRAANTLLALHGDLPRTSAMLFPLGPTNVKRIDGNILLDPITYNQVWLTAQHEGDTGSTQGRALVRALEMTTFDSAIHSALLRDEIAVQHETPGYVLGAINICALAMGTARTYFVPAPS